MRRGGTVTGAVALVSFFVVLCLTVCSILTLSTAAREQALSQAAAEAAAAYYEADRQAVEITASLSGQPAEVNGVAITYEETEEGTVASFSVSAGENQALSVQVLLTGGSCRILCWESGYSGDWTADEDMPVWDGN